MREGRVEGEGHTYPHGVWGIWTNTWHRHAKIGGGGGRQEKPRVSQTRTRTGRTSYQMQMEKRDLSMCGKYGKKSFNEVISDAQVEKRSKNIMNCDLWKWILLNFNLETWKKKQWRLNESVLFICLCQNTSISVCADTYIISNYIYLSYGLLFCCFDLRRLCFPY